MRKVLVAAMLFSGSIVTIVVLNILFCVVMPEYRDILVSAIYTDNIPVVEVKDGEVVEIRESGLVPLSSSVSEAMKKETDRNVAQILREGNNDAGEKEDADADENKPVIVDREYHEDCGTGEGYWVLKYSDGSTEVE